MTPDYGRMAQGLRDLGVAAARTELRLLERWVDLVGRCGRRLADGLDARSAAAGPDGPQDALGRVAGAAGDAARDYVRGLASLPDAAMLDLAAELDAVRRRGADGGS